MDENKQQKYVKNVHVSFSTVNRVVWQENGKVSWHRRAQVPLRNWVENVAQLCLRSDLAVDATNRHRQICFWIY